MLLNSKALVEQQVYRKFATLKSKQTGKYICLSRHTGNFVLKVPLIEWSFKPPNIDGYGRKPIQMRWTLAALEL